MLCPGTLILTIQINKMKSGHRFYLDENLGEGILSIKDKQILHQLRNVLRIQKGGQMEFFNGENDFKGIDFVYELKNIERNSANFLFKEKSENMREPNKRLFLFQALIKKDKFESVLQHGTEVGISEFIPVIAKRSEKKSISHERCEKILREAAEQSGRAVIPKISKPLDLKDAIYNAKKNGFKTYFAYEKEKDHMIYGAGDRQVNLFVGPEGGWDEKEVFMFTKSDACPISLGRLTLRSETAAIVASYTLLWG